ncbi:MAG: alcohol dehydrogenase catalytic domain-containing protein [Candidatus Bathyarchaeia archaeon]
MKAAVLYGPRDLRIVEDVTPDPKDTQILLKIEACGICGSDIRMWREGPPSGKGNIVLGHEIAASVLYTGAKIRTQWREGMRLAIAADVNCDSCYYCKRGLYNLCENKKIIGRDLPGGLADVMVLEDDVLQHGIMHLIPEGVTASEAAMAEPLASVVHLQKQLNIQPGTVVVVFGAGPIGCLHVELAKLQGAEVVLLEVDGNRLEYVKNITPADYFAKPCKTEIRELIQEVTQGVGADVAIVACSSADAQALAVELVRKRGIVVFFGGLSPTAPLTTLNANVVHYREIQIMGAFSYCPWDHELALQLIASRKIFVKKYITEYSLHEVPKVFSLLSDSVKGAKIIKAVIIP